MQHIHTKLHELWPIIDSEDSISFDPTKDKMDNAEHKQKADSVIRVLVSRVIASQLCVIQPDVLALASTEATLKSLQALLTCGIFALPFSPMTCEFSLPGIPEWREFILMEDGKDGRIEAWYIRYNSINGTMLAGADSYVMEGTSDGVIMYHPTLTESKIAEQFANVAIHGSVLALQCALLMLNTLGIEREVIDPHKLNKHRIAKGRTAIPTHTVVHVGKVYRRDGTYDRVNGATGRTMPMHLRSAHVRNVPFGPRAIELADRPTRKVFVPGCIVNFKPEETLTRHVKEVQL